MRSANPATCALLLALASTTPAFSQDRHASSEQITPASTAAPLLLPTAAPPAVTLPQGEAEPTATAPVAAQPVVEAVTVDPVVAALIEDLKSRTSRKSIHKDDRAALETYYGAAGVQTVWTDGKGLSARGAAARREIAAADDWGLRAQAFDLPADSTNADIAGLADAELKLAVAVLEYARHARGGRMDPTDLSFNIDRKPPLLDPLRVLADAATAAEVDGYLRKLHPQHPQFELLRQKYLEAKRAPAEARPEEPGAVPQSKGKASAKQKQKQSRPEQRLATRILYNMEMWRWMPEELGETYVVSNIPEYMMRVVKGGKTIHEERVIVGKVDTQTPVFSDKMDHIVFHPFWGVPDSIKVKDVWPSLVGSGGAMARYGLRIQQGGRDIDPSKVNWTTTDIRRFHVYQPPGPNNVLGVVKFMFPNRHQVYMHDTPTKNLFNSARRTFSHGCVRMRNPMRFAEVLLENDKGWSASRVASLVQSGPQNNHIYLDSKVPVHMTYFTAVVNSEGKLQMFSDIYGHEPRIQMGLEGKAHLIVKKKPSLTPPDAVSRLAETKQSYPLQNWMKQVFGNF